MANHRVEQKTIDNVAHFDACQLYRLAPAAGESAKGFLVDGFGNGQNGRFELGMEWMVVRLERGVVNLKASPVCGRNLLSFRRDKESSLSKRRAACGDGTD